MDVLEDLVRETNLLLRMIAEAAERMSPPLPVRALRDTEAVFGKENVDAVQVEAWKEEEVATPEELARERAKQLALDTRLSDDVRRRVAKNLSDGVGLERLRLIIDHCEGILAKQGVSR